MIKSVFNVGVLVTGTALGQGLAFLLTPVLTRIVTPETYGYFSVFLSFAAILSVCVTLGYESAIVIQKTKKAANILSGILLWIVAITSVLGGITLTGLAYAIGLGLPPLYFLGAIPFCLVVGGYTVFQYRLMRDRQFIRLGFASFNNNFAKMAGQVGFVLAANATAFFLILGDIIGRVMALFSVASLSSIIKATRYPSGHLRKAMVILKRERKLLYFQLPSNFAEIAVFWLPVLVFGWLYGVEEAGLTAFLIRLFSAAGTLIGTSLSDVYYATAHRFYGTYRLPLVTFMVVIALCAFMGAGWIAIYILGDEGFRFLFGDAWDGLWSLALAMAPILLMTGIAQIAGRYGLIMQTQYIRLGFYIFCLIGIGVLTWFAHVNNLTFIQTAHALSYGGFVMAMLFLAVLLWIDIGHLKNKIAKTAQNP